MQTNVCSGEFTVDFIGIGSGKSGSTWLYENIVKHPSVFSGNPKEINYFHKEYLYDRVPFDWYREQFRGAPLHAKKGEFSVVYMYGENTAELIKERFPKVKIIAILRDPIERTYSDYWHSIRKNEFSANRPFSDYISVEHNCRFGRYADFLKPFAELFDQDKMKIILLEQASKSPLECFQDIYGFINVDRGFVPEDFDERVNQAVFYRSLIIERIMTNFSGMMNRRGFTRFIETLKRIGVASTIRRFNEKHRDKPQINSDDMIALRSYFHDSNDTLRKEFGLPIEEFWS